MTAPLSSLFGKSVLTQPGTITADDQAGAPLSSFFGQDPLGAGHFTDSPDNLLAQNIGLDDAARATALANTPPTAQTTRNEPGTVPAPPGAAAPHGDAAAAIDAAMSVVGRPYVWGGTFQGSAGGDCSGLLYYAFNAAGISMPRYRAVDYGHMGAPVSTQDARPGDIVYFDEPGDTDHVGIYLGNGQFIESPHQGSHVMVSPLRGGAQIRRILPDSAMHGIPVDPGGNLTFHADNTVFTGGKAPADHPGPQRDPVEQLQAMDAGASLQGIEGQGQPGGSPLGFLNTATPESIFGQVAPTQQATTSAFHPGPATTGGGPGGQTVGSVSGLSADEAWIIQHESGGDPTAQNPTSTAFGIWQGLAGTRQSYAKQLGFSPNTTDVNQQLQMFRAYISDRYGDAANARAFWQAHHWY